MIAKPGKPPLIQETRVDQDAGTVTLYMPNLDEGIAKASVQPEIERIALAAKEGTSVTFQYGGGHGMVEIKGGTLAEIALNTTKVMTRRVTSIDPEGVDGPYNYAAQADTESVLRNIKAIAERQGSTYAATAVDKLLGAVSQAYRA